MAKEMTLEDAVEKLEIITIKNVEEIKPLPYKTEYTGNCRHARTFFRSFHTAFDNIYRELESDNLRARFNTTVYTDNDHIRPKWTLMFCGSCKYRIFHRLDNLNGTSGCWGVQYSEREDK